MKIAVLSPHAKLSADTLKSRRWMYGVLAGFLILAVSFGLIISRSLQNQMGGFLDAARRVGGGDFTAEVPTHGNDEFALLGVEFNKMAGLLQDRMHDLSNERARLQEAMRTIGETFASNLDREALLEIVVRAAVDGVDADAGRGGGRPPGPGRF
jgi:nitrogen fixation/metabolism regulation signal transduction histidine kinase